MIAPMRRYVSETRLLVTAVALFAAGCGGLTTSDVPAERVYWLEPLDDAAVDLPETGPANERSIVAVRVEAAPGLDTDRLLILEDDARLNEYEAARWAARAPEVVESLLKTSLEVPGSFLRVADRTAMADVDARLALELRRFFAHDGNVQIELVGHLDCSDGADAISALASAPILEQRLSAIVAAFQAALDDASESVARAVAAGRCFQGRIPATSPTTP